MKNTKYLWQRRSLEKIFILNFLPRHDAERYRSAVSFGNKLFCFERKPTLIQRVYVFYHLHVTLPLLLIFVSLTPFEHGCFIFRGYWAPLHMTLIVKYSACAKPGIPDIEAGNFAPWKSETRGDFTRRLRGGESNRNCTIFPEYAIQIFPKALEPRRRYIAIYVKFTQSFFRANSAWYRHLWLSSTSASA